MLICEHYGKVFVKKNYRKRLEIFIALICILCERRDERDFKNGSLFLSQVVNSPRSQQGRSEWEFLWEEHVIILLSLFNYFCGNDKSDINWARTPTLISTRLPNISWNWTKYNHSLRISFNRGNYELDKSSAGRFLRILLSWVTGRHCCITKMLQLLSNFPCFVNEN